MEPVAGRDYVYCPYCAAFAFPSALEDSADRVTPLADESDLSCPICKIELSVGAGEKQQVFFCAKCRGILLSSDDLMGIVRKRRAAHEGPPEEQRPLDQEQLKRQIVCPKCSKQMEVHPYYGPGAVVIDSCGRCKVVWMDHGELAVIERAPGPKW